MIAPLAATTQSGTTITLFTQQVIAMSHKGSQAQHRWPLTTANIHCDKNQENKFLIKT